MPYFKQDTACFAELRSTWYGIPGSHAEMTSRASATRSCAFLMVLSFDWYTMITWPDIFKATMVLVRVSANQLLNSVDAPAQNAAGDIVDPR